MKRALIIDDNQQIIELLQEGLSMEGFSVEGAGSGEEGLEKYHTENFDIVITDINLPNCSGNEVAKQIRDSERPHTPLIAISGTPWELAGEYFDAVIQKPFSLIGLLDKVNEILGEDDSL